MSLSEAALAGAVGQARPDHAAGRFHTGERFSGAGLFTRLEAMLDAERGRWFLWLPVFFGLGIAIYLGAPEEPPLALALAAVIIASALRLFCRETTFRLIASSILLLTTLGFLAGKLQTLLVAAPVLERAYRFVELEGWVERVEKLDKRVRLTIRPIRVHGLTPEKTPRRVRISVSAKAEPPRPGQAIRVRATLMPPPEPAQPGGFDFGRHYWFLGIGASGYVTGKIEPLSPTEAAPLDFWLAAWLANLRSDIAGRIGAVLEGDRGALAKALIMGERGELSQGSMEALRDSGLAHVISISGLHMALTAGAAFWVLRALLALIPAIALRYPIKVWAAVGALAIASLYLAISGAAVTAVRAYIMVTIIFIAIILNRPAISQRNLAFAALVILAFMPNSIVDAGFQMSFAATAALIAFYEARPRLRLFDGWPRLLALPLLFITEAALTALLAGFAVDILGAYHFHRIATYSVLGNVLAMPVVTFLVMPMAPLALIAMPFGLEAWPLLIMDQGLALMLAAARFTAALPGAVIPVAAFAEAAFPLMAAGGLWLLIWTARWRWLGLIPLGAGLALAPFAARPDIWVDREGALVAIRDASGAIAAPGARKASFSLARWMEADGDLRPLKEARGSKSFQCDASSCVALVKGKLVSHVVHPSALADDCRRADVLIANFPLPEGCVRPRVVIDQLDLRERGAHTVRLTPDGPKIRAVTSERGERPWVPAYKRRVVIPVIAAGDADSEGDPAEKDEAGKDQ